MPSIKIRSEDKEIYRKLKNPFYMNDAVIVSLVLSFKENSSKYYYPYISLLFQNFYFSVTF